MDCRTGRTPAAPSIMSLESPELRKAAAAALQVKMSEPLDGEVKTDLRAASIQRK